MGNSELAADQSAPFIIIIILHVKRPKHRIVKSINRGGLISIIYVIVYPPVSNFEMRTQRQNNVTMNDTRSTTSFQLKDNSA